MKSPTSFPMSLRWTLYVASNPQRGPQKRIYCVNSHSSDGALWSNAHTRITCLLSDCLSHYGAVTCALAVRGSGPTCSLLFLTIRRTVAKLAQRRPGTSIWGWTWLIRCVGALVHYETLSQHLRNSLGCMRTAARTCDWLLTYLLCYLPYIFSETGWTRRQHPWASGSTS